MVLWNYKDEVLPFSAHKGATLAHLSEVYRSTATKQNDGYQSQCRFNARVRTKVFTVSDYDEPLLSPRGSCLGHG